MTCVAAVTPRLVTEEDLGHANAARAAIGQASIVAGPAFGALLLLLGSPTAAFLANAVSFGLAAAVVASLPAGELFAPGGSRSRLLADLRAGAAALRDAPAARRMVEADAMGSVVYGALTVLLLVVSHDLGWGAAGYGYMLAALGLGGLLATGVAGHAAGGRSPLAALTAAMLLIAITLSLLAVAPTLAAVLAIMLLLGAGNVMLEVLAETGLQRSLDDEVFARAYGLAMPATLAGIVAGSLLAAPLAALLGVTGALTGLAAMVAAHALVLAQPMRTRWRTFTRSPSSV